MKILMWKELNLLQRFMLVAKFALIIWICNRSYDLGNKSFYFRDDIIGFLLSIFLLLSISLLYLFAWLCFKLFVKFKHNQNLQFTTAFFPRGYLKQYLIAIVFTAAITPILSSKIGFEVFKLKERALGNCQLSGEHIQKEIVKDEAPQSAYEDHLKSCMLSIGYEWAPLQAGCNLPTIDVDCFR